MTTVTISLPESLRDFIAAQVKTKGYGNVSEYFRGLLREAQEREADKRLETLLLESLDDPRSDINITPEFWEGVKKRFVDRVERKRRSSARK
jgi:antitoxin ParD1/3/4